MARANTSATSHARRFFHLPPAGVVAAVIARAIAHGDKRRHGEADLAAVELDAIAADVAGFLQPLDALHDRGSRETDLVGNRLIAGPTILSEDAKNASVSGVELVPGGHLGSSPRVCPTIRC